MHSHRRPRGRILFEAVCALTVGVSFVGAWIQTGAWAFIGPAFVCTLFGLYWAIDMFGQDSPARVVEPEAAPVRVDEQVRPAQAVHAADPPLVAEPEIRFERFEAPVEAAPAPVSEQLDVPEAHTDAVPFVSDPEPVFEAEPAARAEAKSRTRKPRAKKAIEPVVDQKAAVAAEDPAFDHHIEQLFDPKPFARQARPAFGKRPRGPGPRPLPAG